MQEKKERDITIVGCGFAAVALGISLKKAGLNNFTILERSNEIGGVWRENTYPGAACDVPSRLYSFSFEQDYPWSLRYAPQKEIFEYLKHCIDKYSLTPHIRLGVNVTKASYDDESAKWSVVTKSGEEIALIYSFQQWVCSTTRQFLTSQVKNLLRAHNFIQRDGTITLI